MRADSVSPPGDSASELGCILVHEVDRGTVAWLRGDLDALAAPKLLRFLLEIIDLPVRRLTLDMAEVREVDAAGSTVLQVAGKVAASRGVELVLDAVPPGVVVPCLDQCRPDD